MVGSIESALAAMNAKPTRVDSPIDRAVLGPQSVRLEIPVFDLTHPRAVATALRHLAQSLDAIAAMKPDKGTSPRMIMSMAKSAVQDAQNEIGRQTGWVPTRRLWRKS